MPSDTHFERIGRICPIGRIFQIAAYVIFITTVVASAQTPLRRWIPNPAPDSLSTGYYVVDSDDPSRPPWRPVYEFADTTYQRSSWKRIYPGPLSLPPAQPSAICWKNISGDTTDNTFAGPIPIGFKFNFYSVDYDSVYLSSNGYIGFGNFLRASGGDGAAYSTFAPGPLPNALAPKAIAAFLMTDGEMVRTNKDSSRAFYRVSPSADSFFITVYNYYHISGPSTANYVHRFHADVQIVLSVADSAIQFRYRKFYDGLTYGLSLFTTETGFRIGCIPTPCPSLASVIGVQNASQTTGTTYLANGQFTSRGSIADLHSGLAVKFRRWPNVAQCDSIALPQRNHEMMVGDSLAPSAVFGNVALTTQTLLCMFRIRNITNDSVVYFDSVLVNALAPGATQRVTFRTWMSDTASNSHIGTLLAEAFVVPARDSAHLIGDAWPFDDTLRQVFFVLKRWNNFVDFNSNFSSPKVTPGTIPSTQLWVNINAAVVDGDIFTYSPPPVRGKQGDPAFAQLNSPVIKFDRLDANGNEYNRCAFGGIGAIGDGGVGDTIISFPINLAGTTNSILGFSYERAGKKTYPRWYDLATALGPERTVTDPTHTQILRAGDSLEVAFADPSQTTNVSLWKEQWSKDGGKDFNFSRVFLPINAPYNTANFRFRIRLKAKNDFEAGNPSDDYDEWYVDNIAVITPKKPEIEVSYCRIGASWAYERVPASQAVSVPIEVSIVNNGTDLTAAFGIAVTISGDGDTHIPPNVCAKLISIPVLGGGKSTLLTAPPWNARQAGPGPYHLTAYMLPKGFDYEAQNDSTYYQFTMLFDSSYVYDNGVNDIPGYYQLTGLGLKMQELDPSAAVGGDNTISGNGSGTIAVKFTIYQRDTIYGAQLWLGSFNQNPDGILLSMYNSGGVVPGPLIQGSCATYLTTRQGPWDAFGTYRFSCGPIVLDPGDYWMGVSQLGNSALQLGAAAYKSSVDWTVYDAGNFQRDSFVMNYPGMYGKFAYENTAQSGSWYPFYFPAGVGKPGFSYPDSSTAFSRNSANCGKPYNYFYGEGSWIPLIRPYFETRSFGPRDIGCWQCAGQLSTTTREIIFDTLSRCAPHGSAVQKTIPLKNIGDAALTVSLTIRGLDSASFRLVNGYSHEIAPGNTFAQIIECSVPVTLRDLAATLHCDAGSNLQGTVDIPMSLLIDSAITTVGRSAVTFHDVPVGSVDKEGIPISIVGKSECAITAISASPNTSQFYFTIKSQQVTPGVPDTVFAFFAPDSEGIFGTTLSIATGPCKQVHTIMIAGNSIPPSAVAEAVRPLEPHLFQNRPNPFTNNTTIEFDLAERTNARLVITDVLGRVCAVICDEKMSAGHHVKDFAQSSLPAGTYVCALQTSGGVVRRVMVKE